MLIKADLHNHFRTSAVWKAGDFNRAIDAARARLEEGGIVALVNFFDDRYETFLGLKGYEREDKGTAIYVPEKQIWVVKGQEVQTAEGHLLVLGLEKGKKLQTGREIPLDYALKEATDNGGIKVADHPFGREGIGNTLLQNEKLIEMLDGIEVYNGEARWIPGITPRNANARAEEEALRFKLINSDLGFLASSDGHSFYEIGSVYTQFTTEEPIDRLTNEELKRRIKHAAKKNLYFKNSLKGYVGAVDHLASLAYITALKKS